MELPKKYEENMRELLGPEYNDYEACLDGELHHGIRVNTNKISVEDFLKISPFALTPVPWCKNGFYYNEKQDTPSKHPYYYAGLYYIQEPSAMTPAAVLPVEPGNRVLDLCAAPGGKSTELCAKMNGEGVLVSNDISATRAKALLKNLELFGSENSLVISEAPYKLSTRFAGYFDRILIDAPCSGEGMFRKGRAMISAWEQNGNQTFVDIQRSILPEAVKMLSPGGYLLYSTCTFSPAENEQAIEYLLELDESLELVEFEKTEGFDNGHPEWGNTNNAELTKCARLWPHKIEGEGHFVCLVKKSADGLPQSAGDYEIKPVKLPDEVKDFLSKINKNYDSGRFELSGEKLYYIPAGFPAVKGLRILRCGIYMGEVKKKRFEPSQALAMTLSAKEYANSVSLPASDPRVLKYLKGETIELSDCENGYVLFCVDGYPLGWGKYANGSLKNKYLAGWRLLS